MASYPLEWVKLWVEGSQGKVMVCLPGLAQATRATRDEAIDAVVERLNKIGRTVKSVDREMGKLLITQ